MNQPHITVEMIRAMVAKMKMQAMRTLRDSSGDFYVMAIPESMAHEAYELGLAPFCALDPDSIITYARSPA